MKLLHKTTSIKYSNIQFIYLNVLSPCIVYAVLQNGKRLGTVKSPLSYQEGWKFKVEKKDYSNCFYSTRQLAACALIDYISTH